MSCVQSLPVFLLLLWVIAACFLPSIDFLSVFVSSVHRPFLFFHATSAIMPRKVALHTHKDAHKHRWVILSADKRRTHTQTFHNRRTYTYTHRHTHTQRHSTFGQHPVQMHIITRKENANIHEAGELSDGIRWSGRPGDHRQSAPWLEWTDDLASSRFHPSPFQLSCRTSLWLPNWSN